MDIQTTKIALIKEILDIENPETLLKVGNIIGESNFDIDAVNENIIDYDNLKPSQQKRKLAFINDFINLENEETISKLEKSLWLNNDFWNDLTLSQQEEIKKAELEIVNEETTSYETFMSSHR
ncbi:hypothetical protein [Polaribacter sejongensis]|uniref:hypothetical protein n=1 Tax=Polaribacter sejongensis TaxID=985043 RepID=UPI001AD8418F|nr:hypothetical protein [Polaribacter sejongensis]